MTPSPAASPSPRMIVLIGLVSLAVAMGIGRFAFTPLMPLMVRDGSLDGTTGAEWAAANYIGYLAGALTASWLGQHARWGLLLGLLGVAGSTLGMALTGLTPAWAGGVWRAVAGICSAWVLVCASSWCLPELARRGAAAMGGWMYTGVGVGIALTGILTWVGGQQSALLLWIELGLLALLGVALVWRALPGASTREGQPTPSAFAQSTQPPPAKHSPIGLILCYGAFGYGYIVPATYLPTMARALVDDPWVFGLTWPVFGLAAALSVAFASRWLSTWPRRRVWALAQGVMAMGTLIPLLWQSLPALALSAVLVGGTFMVATMAGLQLAREERPSNPTPLLARMTGAFAAGQIAGPVLIRLLSSVQIQQSAALHWANTIATLVLVSTAAWLWRGTSENRLGN